MCYITESAIDHEISSRGHLKCDRCEGKFKELYDVEFCTTLEDRLAEMNNEEAKSTKMEVCENCYNALKNDTQIILY